MPNLTTRTRYWHKTWQSLTRLAATRQVFRVSLCRILLTPLQAAAAAKKSFERIIEVGPNVEFDHWLLYYTRELLELV